MISGIDKTDIIVANILKERYGNVKIVKDTPRFICGDIRAEAMYSPIKINNKPIIQFSESRFKKMRDDDIVFVFCSDGSIVEFKWKDRNDKCIIVKKENKEQIVVKCSLETKLKYKEIENKLKTSGEQTILKLIEIANKKIMEEEKNKKFETI